MAAKKITKFEDLSNELLFDIFEYFYGDALIDAFYGHNRRINSILNDYRLLMHIAFSRISKIQSIYDSDQIQFVNVTPSYSEPQGMLFSAPYIANDLKNCSLMPHVRQFSINKVYISDLIVGLSYIKSRMPNLVHVAIKMDDYSVPRGRNITFIIERLLDLYHIRTLSLKLKLTSTSCYPREAVYTGLSPGKQAPFLEHFSIIGCNFFLRSIIDLMKNSPNLYSLQMKIQKTPECLNYCDYSVFQQLTKATLKLMGFNNYDLQRFFSSMTRLVSLRLDDKILISTARLYISDKTRISQAPVGYFAI